MICLLRHRTTAFNYNDITDVSNIMEEKQLKATKNETCDTTNLFIKSLSVSFLK